MAGDGGPSCDAHPDGNALVAGLGAVFMEDRQWRGDGPNFSNLRLNCELLLRLYECSTGAVALGKRRADIMDKYHLIMLPQLPPSRQGISPKGRQRRKI
jgi:hypothetical protein